MGPKSMVANRGKKSIRLAEPTTDQLQYLWLMAKLSNFEEPEIK